MSHIISAVSTYIIQLIVSLTLVLYIFAYQRIFMTCYYWNSICISIAADKLWHREMKNCYASDTLLSLGMVETNDDVFLALAWWKCGIFYALARRSIAIQIPWNNSWSKFLFPHVQYTMALILCTHVLPWNRTCILVKFESTSTLWSLNWEFETYFPLTS